MANMLKLKSKIVEKGATMEQVSNAIGVDTSTLYRKFAKNGDSFTVAEANNIGRFLQLNSLEMNEIFFTI